MDINIADGVEMTFNAEGLDELISLWGKHKPSYGWVYEIRQQGCLEVLLVKTKIQEVLPHVRFAGTQEEWKEIVCELLEKAGIETAVRGKFIDLWEALDLSPGERLACAYSNEVGPNKDSFVGFFGREWTFAITLSK